MTEIDELRAENERLRAEMDALRTWQARRVVAISEDPTCVRWMLQSEDLDRELAKSQLRCAALAVARDELRSQLVDTQSRAEAAEAAVRALAAEDDPEKIARFRTMFPVAALSVAPQSGSGGLA